MVLIGAVLTFFVIWIGRLSPICSVAPTTVLRARHGS